VNVKGKGKERERGGRSGKDGSEKRKRSGSENEGRRRSERGKQNVQRIATTKKDGPVTMTANPENTNGQTVPVTGTTGEKEKGRRHMNSVPTDITTILGSTTNGLDMTSTTAADGKNTVTSRRLNMHQTRPRRLTTATNLRSLLWLFNPLLQIGLQLFVWSAIRQLALDPLLNSLLQMR